MLLRCCWGATNASSRAIRTTNPIIGNSSTADDAAAIAAVRGQGGVRWSSIGSGNGNRRDSQWSRGQRQGWDRDGDELIGHVQTARKRVRPSRIRSSSPSPSSPPPPYWCGPPLPSSSSFRLPIPTRHSRPSFPISMSIPKPLQYLQQVRATSSFLPSSSRFSSSSPFSSYSKLHGSNPTTKARSKFSFDRDRDKQPPSLHDEGRHRPNVEHYNQHMQSSWRPRLGPEATYGLLGKDLDLFSQAGFDMEKIHLKRNAPVAQLYEDAIKYEGAVLASSGALINFSGKKTGRSPKDKRIVYEETSKDDVWWGTVNIKMDEHTFEINRERAIDFLNTRDNVYVFDGFAGWDPKYRIKVRVICARAYHALFMHNMLIRPTAKELEEFGEPDFTIYNAGQFPANRFTAGMTSSTSVEVNFKRKEMVILGTEYAGEMKKGIFSVMHYLQPVKFGQLSLHSSANEGKTGDVTLFFGLSGTGKTTLSADPARQLIGDDEHVWSDQGVFNIEGGCYAKCVGLNAEKEPEIYGAIRFGSILENVTYDYATREPNYEDTGITENTRCAYPIEYIDNAKIPCMSSSQPSNVIYLTCDAYGVLPPVSLLNAEQAQYWFLSGYTSKTPGTEDGITEPSPTFSTCFGQPFIILHPSRYASMLAQRMTKSGTNCWLVNTGWTGGKFGVGKRCPLKYTRAIIDAIHDGSLAKAEFETFPVFNLKIPKAVGAVPAELLDPVKAWPNKSAFEAESKKLAGMFNEAFQRYAADCSPEVVAAGPTI